MKTLSRLLILACAAAVAFAQSICPAAGGTSPFPHPPDPTGTGCNVVITIAANGTPSVQVTDSTPYEESEDVLVGVKNNSTSTVASIGLTGTDIFGFDGTAFAPLPLSAAATALRPNRTERTRRTIRVQRQRSRSPPPLIPERSTSALLSPPTAAPPTSASRVFRR